MADELEPEKENPKPPENGGQDLPPAGAVESGTGTAAALDAAETQVSAGSGSGSGVAPRKRGRPIIHGAYSQAAGSDGKKAVLTVPLADDIPEDQSDGLEERRSVLALIPDDLRDEIVVEMMGLAEDLGKGTLEPLALKCGLSQTEISAETAKATLGETRKKLVAKLLPHAAREIGFDPNVSACAAIGILVGPSVVRFGYSWVTLARIAKERNQNAPAPPAVTAQDAPKG